MRKIIARRLVEAKQTIPHFYLSIDCELDALLKLREEVNRAAPRDKDANPLYKLSVNDFIIKALAQALIRVPDANVTYTESTMLHHEHADVAVAVALPEGLITPDRAECRPAAALGTLRDDERLCCACKRAAAEAARI